MRYLTAIEGLLALPETPIRELLARINDSEYLFQLIVDADGRLLGTVTDGDVRRAMLRGVGLDDPASKCMHENPATGRVGAEDENLAKLDPIGSANPFLPVLDDNAVVCAVLVKSGREAAASTALIMAGGPGTRLGRRTHSTPKPLLPVGEKPILEHVLTGLESAGVGEIYISVHYLAEQIGRFIANRRNQANVQIIPENERLGTVGALAHLPSRPLDPVLIVNGDVITHVDYAAMTDFHRNHQHDGTVAVARYEVQVPFGVIQQGSDGLLENIEEKPLTSHFVAAGIYYLSPEFIDLIPRGESLDMPELLIMGRSRGLRVGLFPIHEYWIDVGRPDDLEEAEAKHRCGE